MNFQTKPQIVLASNSVGRKLLLEKLGVPFSTLPSNIDEYSLTDAKPIKMMQMRARAKAEEVVRKLSSWSPAKLFILNEGGTIGSPDNKRDSIASLQNDFLMVAADSEAVLDGKTYGKAKNKAHAKDMIKKLMGKTHDFVTATCIINISCKPKSAHLSFPRKRESKEILDRVENDTRELNRWEDVATTRVTLRSLDASSLDAYIDRYDFSRFAAAYTFNETPWDLITKIDGSYTNVIGLPFEVLLPILRKLKLV